MSAAAVDFLPAISSFAPQQEGAKRTKYIEPKQLIFEKFCRIQGEIFSMTAVLKSDFSSISDNFSVNLPRESGMRPGTDTVVKILGYF